MNTKLLYTGRADNQHLSKASYAPWLDYLAGYSACQTLLRNSISNPHQSTEAILSSLESHRLASASRYLAAIELTRPSQQPKGQATKRDKVWRPWWHTFNVFYTFVKESPMLNPRIISLVETACLERKIAQFDWPKIRWKAANSEERLNVVYF